MMRFNAAGSSGRLSGAIGTPAVDQICSRFGRLNHWLSQFAAACRQTKISRPAPAATSVAASASRSLRATTHRDAPGVDADLAGREEVEVMDPRHPLYRRRFRLLSVVRGRRSPGFVYVEYRLDVSLILPISATSLQATVAHIVPTKLSLEALGDLVTVAEGREGECRSSPAMSGEACLRACAGRSPTISPSSSGR